MNVFITGAASGLGLATSKYYASKGHNVYAADINKPESDENIFGYKLDVTNIDEIKQLKQTLMLENIKLDIIINFAGIHDMGSFLEKDLNRIKQIIDINVLGTINVNQIMYDLLTEKGKIIIITSEVAPLDPMPFNGIYNVSKTALDCYAQSLRQEMNLNNKKVITIRPGSFNTKLANGSLDSTKKLVDETLLYKKQSKKFYKIVKTFIGKPKDPTILAKLIYKVSLKKNPKLIYSKNRNIGLWLLNLLPKRMQCFIIKLLLK
jgi:NAD(P)-dependent dehydrogenase (short-subunit alcohol dehydrogenase family)